MDKSATWSTHSTLSTGVKEVTGIVVLTGITGVDVGVVADFARRELKAETIKLEELISEEFNAPIYHVAELLLVDRRRVIERFRKTFTKLKEIISDIKDKPIILTMHLTYYRRRHIVPNPVLAWLHEVSGIRGVIYYVEDYYHALQRLADRALKGVTPSVARGQMLDPLGLLYWRAADQSILTMLAAQGLEVYVMANKHSKEQHARLLASLLGVERNGVKRFRKAYVSHPITKVKRRALEDGIPISMHPDAREIEEFKNIITRRCKDLIVFSPTSIDELILDKGGELKTMIEEKDRWPFPHDTLHRDYRFPINLADEVFEKMLYPTRETVLNRSYMRVVKSLIEAQIESRDMMYVTQSDLIIAYRPTMYGELHMGVDTEVRVATAQAKPVYALLPGEEEFRDYTLFSFWYALRDIDELLSALHCD